MAKKVYIEAENFRDKAWGKYDIDDEYELVLEMTHGYSDLYIRRKGEDVAYTDEIFFEECNHKAINEYTEREYGVIFVS